MHEAYFGLKSRPFGSNAEGARVFAGPQQTKIMSSLKKGLAAPDAVVTVTGAVGAGKTTIVNRALESISPGRLVAWVGRMQLGPEEVLELLLAGFGIQAQSRGTIQRFTAFRRLLAERAAIGTRVAIVVEDAQRLGLEALVELEALTAADAGDGASANIILMGHPGLNTLLAAPGLARLKQRNRLRQAIEPLSRAEADGYLIHGIREAGGDYDRIFEPGVADIVFACSEGIPRVINTLCQSALTAAAEDAARRVSAPLMHRIAAEAFGYDSPAPAASTATASRPATRTPAPPQRGAQPAQPAAAPRTPPHKSNRQTPLRTTPVNAGAGSARSLLDVEALDETHLPAAARNIVVESGQYPVLPDPAVVPPVKATPAPADTPAAPTEEDLPELIDRTVPELSLLQPAVSQAVGVDVTPAAKLAPPPEDVNSEAKPAKEERRPGNGAAPSAADPDEGDGEFDLDAVLAIDVDETNIMAGLTPDIDSVAGDLRSRTPGSGRGADAAPVQENLPTLSNSMRVDIDREVKRVKGETAPPRKPQTAKSPEDPVRAKGTPADMTARMAAIDPGKRVNDVDAMEAALEAAKHMHVDELVDAPASPPIAGPRTAPRGPEPNAAIPEITLDRELPKKPQLKPIAPDFAEQISKANSLEEFSDAMAETLFGEEFSQIAAEVVANPPPDHTIAVPPPDGPSPVRLDASLVAALADDDDLPDLSLEDEPEVTPDEAPSAAGLRQSQAMRLEMLKALSGRELSGPAEEIELGREPSRDQPAAAKTPQPEPIEAQIDVSITQTLKTLQYTQSGVSPPPPGDDEDEKKSNGLFSRFRKSS